MWGCSQLYCLYYWPCSSWYWLLRHLLWSHHHHHESGAPPQTANITGIHGCSLRYIFCHRTVNGRSLHNQSLLEMVLLYQSSCRRTCCGHPYPHPSCTSSQESRHSLETAGDPARPYRHRLFCFGHRLSFTSFTMGWINLRLAQWTHRRPTGALCYLHIGIHWRTDLEERDRHHPSTHRHATEYSRWYVVAVLCWFSNDGRGLLHPNLVTGY